MGFDASKLLRENVFQPNFKFVERCFQFIQSEVMFASFDSEKRLVG